MKNDHGEISGRMENLVLICFYSLSFFLYGYVLLRSSVHFFFFFSFVLLSMFIVCIVHFTFPQLSISLFFSSSFVNTNDDIRGSAAANNNVQKPSFLRSSSLFLFFFFVSFVFCVCLSVCLSLCFTAI